MNKGKVKRSWLQLQFLKSLESNPTGFFTSKPQAVVKSKVIPEQADTRPDQKLAFGKTEAKNLETKETKAAVHSGAHSNLTAQNLGNTERKH